MGFTYPISSYRIPVVPRVSSHLGGLQIRVGRFDSGSRLQEFAAVAQLVERNLAKVEVESSRLFCRSKYKGKAPRAFPLFISDSNRIEMTAREVSLPHSLTQASCRIESPYTKSEKCWHTLAAIQQRMLAKCEHRPQSAMSTNNTNWSE